MARTRKKVRAAKKRKGSPTAGDMISKKTLKMLDKAADNFKKGKVSDPIDIPDVKDRPTTEPTTPQREKLKCMSIATPDELEAAAIEYFKKCDSRMRDVATKSGVLLKLNIPEPYTLTGLCLHCGFSSTKKIQALEKEPAYKEVIEFIRLKCENSLVGRLLEGQSPVGCIFALKNNYGWTDTQVLDHQSAGEKIAQACTYYPSAVKPKIGGEG